MSRRARPSLDRRRLHRVHLVPVHFQMLRRLRLAPGQQQVHHLSLKLRDEPRSCFRPRHQHRPHPMGRALAAGHAATKPGRTVHRVQMPPPAHRGMVVDRARPPALGARRLEALASISTLQSSSFSYTATTRQGSANSNSFWKKPVTLRSVCRFIRRFDQLPRGPTRI